jgi:carbon-monoxide dehydrogenase large subunit
MRKVNSLIGTPVERVEDLRFLRGKGEYVGDLHPEGVVSAVILRSQEAHGWIRSIDATAARKRPGVVGIITAAEIEASLGRVPKIPLRLEILPAFVAYEQPVIAQHKVRYVGEPLAVVMADSAALAEDALEAIVVDIEPLPVADMQHAAPLLFEDTQSNLAATLTGTKGDAEAAFRDAPYRRRERFRVQRHAAVPMEPRGLLAEWDAARSHLTVSGASKVAFANRRILAAQMGLAETAITMIENDVGGGFGARGEFYPEDFLIPFAARHLGQPVKWVEDRRENLMACNHARDVTYELEVACTRDGTILGLRGRGASDLGAYLRTNGATGSRNTVQVMSGPYRIPNIHVEIDVTVSNKTPVGTYRGPGRFECDFFRERLFDMAARDLGIDRVEFRRRNLIAEADMPYRLAKVVPLNIETQTDTGDYQVTLDHCLHEIGWARVSALQGKLIDGRYHGCAVGCYIEGGASGPRENARMVVESDGSVTVYVGSSSIGQGIETIFAQIAADALEIPMERIRVLHGSTTHVTEGFGSFASRSTVMGGSAIVDAAQKLKTALRTAAGKKFGCEADVVELDGDTVVGPARRMLPLAAFADLEVEGTYASSQRTYGYGAHAAHVAVDPRTGHVEVLDYVAIEDVGRIINPLTLHGQSLGAIVQGLGGAFLEHLVYDAQGQLLTASFADYLMPTASDFPSIHCHAFEDRPTPDNPLGAKGAGEGGIIPVGGVIANAVAAALEPLGVEPHELPLSPPRLWTLIAAARKASP